MSGSVFCYICYTNFNIYPKNLKHKFCLKYYRKVKLIRTENKVDREDLNL
jgi:hypothetical protein